VILKLVDFAFTWLSFTAHFLLCCPLSLITVNAEFVYAFCCQDVLPEEVDGQLVTADGAPPYLVVFMSSNGTLQGQYIVCDACKISISARKSTTFGVLVLLLMYNVFDMNYRPQFSMIFLM